MGRLLKFIGWFLGILIVLIIALAVLLPLFVDPNQHKDRIVSEVKKATGRDLSIAGDIGLSVFPWLGLELNGLKLSNAPGFGDSDFASVNHAQVRVKLVPLILSQTLEVDTVKIEGLNLNLAKSKQGVTNWEDMTGGKADASDQLDEAQADGETDTKAMAFSIGGVSVQQAQVVWDDQSTGEHYEIKDLQVKTGSLQPGSPVDVSLGLSLASTQPSLEGKIDLSAVLNADPQQRRVSIEALQLVLQIVGEGLPKQGVEAKLLADLYVDQLTDTLEVKNLSLTSGQLAMSGALQGRDLQTKPSIEGEFVLNEFSPREWMAGFELPAPDTADPSVLQKLSMTMKLTASMNQVTLKRLVMVLDDTRVKGDFELLNPTDPTYKFNLDVDQINLDRYLPTPTEAATSDAAQKEEPLFPVEMLRQLKLDGSLRVGSITAKNVRAEAIMLQVAANNGHLKIDEQVGRFYDGLIKGGTVLDVRGKTPKLKIDQQASRILAGPLLKDLTDTDKLEGSGDFSANLTSAGQTISQLKRALNGSLKFNFTDGAVKGINLAKMIRESKAKLSGQNVALSNEPEQTDFSELTGSAVIKNGILTNQDLLAKSPFVRVEGSGKVNIVMENLDYTVRPVIVSTPKGQGGQGLEELVGIPIPVHLKGPWADPEWNIDLAKVLQEQQKAKLKEKVDSKLQKKLPDLKEKLPGALKGLF